MPYRAILLAAMTLAVAAPAPARAGEMFGVSVNRVFNDRPDSPASWDAPLTSVYGSGIRVARTDAFWMWAEPHPPRHGTHAYDWSRADAVAAALARHRLRWFPVLDYSTPWAASVPTDYHSPPTSNDDFAAYAGAFAARYGRGGSFWASHPELDPLPVTAYEIWNEPNGYWFWRPTPDAGAYADMYLRSRDAIRAADSEAAVVIGGLRPQTRYLRAMYAARPELLGQVDAVGLHPYARKPAKVIANVRDFRRALQGLGDPMVPIVVTEVGWPTSGKGSPIVVSEATRAAALETVTDSLARSDCGVAAVLPYTWTAPEGNPDDFENWYGLRHPDGTPTPSGAAYERVVSRWAGARAADAPRLRLCEAPGLDVDRDGDGLPDAVDVFPPGRG
jgi:polysaccharide biosynthesis protein PslG